MEKRDPFQTSAKWIQMSLAAACLLLALFALVAALNDRANNLSSFADHAVELRDGWTLTDSAGNAASITLPMEIPFGTDGRYTLTRTLPHAQTPGAAATLCVYSNYVDIAVAGPCDVYLYPAAPTKYSPGTGNTWHFVALGEGYAGRTVEISLRCQLGDSIPYLLRPPLLGSKAAMLQGFITRSMPSLMMAFCMLMLAFMLFVLYFWLHKRLKMDATALYTGLFALIFSLYTYCESQYAMLLGPNSYVLYTCTLLLLALLPAPLMCVGLSLVRRGLQAAVFAALTLCLSNFFAQALLHFTGVFNVRSMLLLTHITILISVSVMMLCLLLTDARERPRARSLVIAAMPMVAGGVADILLLWVGKPSFNNSLWFSLGVVFFIFMQFIGFLRAYLHLYRTSIESAMLRDMAYGDSLTGIGNRNAYERALESLDGDPCDGLCCIVADINGLKAINDRHGHAQGDEVIRRTGKALQANLPADAQCFRTGGDEFIALLWGMDEAALGGAARAVSDTLAGYGRAAALDISLAVGCARFQPSDGTAQGLIRRVDGLMYHNKNVVRTRRGI